MAAGFKLPATRTQAGQARPAAGGTGRRPNGGKAPEKGQALPAEAASEGDLGLRLSVLAARPSDALEGAGGGAVAGLADGDIGQRQDADQPLVPVDDGKATDLLIGHAAHDLRDV